MQAPGPRDGEKVRVEEERGVKEGERGREGKGSLVVSGIKGYTYRHYLPPVNKS